MTISREDMYTAARKIDNYAKRLGPAGWHVLAAMQQALIIAVRYENFDTTMEDMVHKVGGIRFKRRDEMLNDIATLAAIKSGKFKLVEISE